MTYFMTYRESKCFLRRYAVVAQEER